MRHALLGHALTRHALRRRAAIMLAGLVGAGLVAVPAVHAGAGSPTLTLTTAKQTVPSGRHIKVTAQLHSGAQGTVTIYATPYQQRRRQIAHAAADDTTGKLTATYAVVRRTLFTAKYDGDATHDATTTSLLVRATGVVTEKLKGGYATRNHVRLYHPNGQPLLVARRLPAARGACLFFRAEHYYSRSWHSAVVSHCIHTDAQGYAAGALTGSHVVGEPYRIRAEWRGNKSLLAHNGAWLRLQFHR